MTSISLEDAAKRVASALGEDDCLLVGGLAVAAWGYVRATTDVDFLVRDLGQASRRLRESGLLVVRRRGGFPCLKGTIGGITFDVLPPLVPIQWDRARTVSLGGNRRIRVVDLEGLVRLKLKAGGPQDLMDVAALVLRHSEVRERAQEIAVAYRIRDKLDAWLRVPRLKAELAEAARAQRGRRNRATRPSTPALPGSAKGEAKPNGKARRRADRSR